MRVIHNWKIAFFLISVLILFAPFLIPNVNAQTGTGYAGLVLDPHKGYPGTKVQVSLDLNTWVSTSGDKASPSLYNGKNFTLVWDIGGWTNDEISAPWETIKNTLLWEKVGSASWDNSGHLTGTATIPNKNQVGDHLLYAISDQGIEGSSMNFWWGFFEILPGGTVITPTPVPTPTPTPTTIPTSHPATCRLTVNWDDNTDTVKVQGIVVSSFNSSYWNDYSWRTTVTLEAAMDGEHDFKGWEWVDSDGTHGNIDQTISLTLNSDTTATAQAQEDPHHGGPIPGFPFESIAIGLLLALGLIYIAKKKSTATLMSPK